MTRRTSDPPDGGWGWVMVGAAFVCHILGGAVIGSLGVLYVAWLDEFGLGKGMTSWVLSLAFGVLFCIGPLASSLSNRFSCRTVALVGSLLASGGYAVSCWANSVSALVVFIGIVTGAGTGLVYVPCVAVVTSYFTTRLPIATGIYTSGVGLGSFLMPPLINLLDDLYGWRGALLVTGAVVAHTVPACLLLTSFRPARGEENHPDGDEEEGDRPDSSRSSIQLEITKEDKNGTLVYHALSNSPSKEKKLLINSGISDGGHAGHYQTTAPDIQFNHGADSIQNSSTVSDNKMNSNHEESHSCVNGTDVRTLTGSTSAIPPSDRQLKYCGDEERLKSCQGAKSSNLAPGAKSVQCLRLQALERPTNSMNDLSRKRHPPPLFSSQSLHESQVLGRNSQTGLSKSLKNFDFLILGSFKDIFLEDKIRQEDKTNLLDDQAGDLSCDDFTKAGADSTLLNDQHSVEGDENYHPPTPPDQKRTFAQTLLQTFSLIRDRTFLLLFISNFFTCLSYCSPLIFLVDRAVDNNIGKTLAAILLSLTGVGNIFGRLCSGVISDRLFSRPLTCYIGVVTINGVATMLSPLCGGILALHAIYALIFGLTIGAFAVLGVMVTVDLMGRDQVASAFGLYLLSAGLGSVLGPPLGGWLFDWTMTYDLTFIVTGSFTLFSALILIPLEVSSRRQSATFAAAAPSEDT